MFSIFNTGVCAELYKQLLVYIHRPATALKPPGGFNVVADQCTFCTYYLLHDVQNHHSIYAA